MCLAERAAAPGPSATDPPAKDATSGATAESGPLNESEASLNRRYKQFERTLLQMAEYLRKTEPERADLLIRAIGKSKEDRVGLQMDQIMDLLKNEQLGDAIGREQHLVANLKGLLELLQSEDRRHQLEEEKKWLESVREEVSKLSVREKELRRATEGQKKPDSLAERQSKIGRDAQSLEQKIDKLDAARNAANRANPSGKQPPKSGKSPDSKIKTRKTKRTRKTKPASRSPIVRPSPTKMGRISRAKSSRKASPARNPKREIRRKKATSNRSHRQRGRILPSRLPLRRKAMVRLRIPLRSNPKTIRHRNK